MNSVGKFKILDIVAKTCNIANSDCKVSYVGVILSEEIKLATSMNVLSFYKIMWLKEKPNMVGKCSSCFRKYVDLEYELYSEEKHGKI